MPDLVPSEFYLGQNYPEPFTEKATIKYCIPERCRVVLTIHGSGGKMVHCLTNDGKSPGAYEVAWDSEDYPTGVYTCRMQAGNYTSAKSMTLIR